MRDFGSWFSEQGKAGPEEVDGMAWFRCTGCGKSELVSIKAYENGDTGWYNADDVEPDESYDSRCGGSQFCLP